MPFSLATSSARRKAQILNRFPNAVIENLRGNVNTRIKKVKESTWHGAVFAAAGIERLGISNITTLSLKWMLPAPAQGAVCVVSRVNDEAVLSACEILNHNDTRMPLTHHTTVTQVGKDIYTAFAKGEIASAVTEHFAEHAVLVTEGMPESDLRTESHGKRRPRQAADSIAT